MADQTLQQTMGDNKTDSKAGGGRTAGDRAFPSGRELKDKAAEFAENSQEKLKETASEFADMARSAADEASERLKEKVSEQKGAGAEYVSNLAETMRRAAREFDSDLPIAGKYIRKAAAQVENVSDSIRTGDFNDLLRNAQSFARRQPTAFLGIAVLAGFAAVRFLKSSSDASDASSARSSGRTDQPNRGHYYDPQI